MDYRQFVEAMRRETESDEEKRRARIAQIRAQQVSAQEEANKGPSNPLEFIGALGKGIFDAATAIPRKVIRTLEAMGNQEEVLGQLRDLDAQYERGELNRQMLEQKVNDITKDIIGNKIAVTDEGVVEADNAQQLGNFARQTVGAGVDTASVLPIARGVQMGVQAGRTAATGAVKETAAEFAKRAAGYNLRQGAVFGTADTANDLIQGREITPGSVALNYALPTAGGFAGDLLGAGISAGVRGTRNAVRSYQAMPRAVREGGYMQLPGRSTNTAEDIATAVRPEDTRIAADTLETDVNPVTGLDNVAEASTRDSSGILDPRTGLRSVDAPEGAGVVTRSREQIMKDNKVVRPFWQRVNEALFDANAPLRDFSKEYTARTGKVLDVADDPHAMAQLRNGMDEAAAARMQTMVNDMEYIRKNKLSDAWREYGVANQVVNDRNGIYPASVVQAEQAKLQRLQSELTPEQLSEVQAAVQKTIDFQDNQLQRLRDAGFISQAGYDAIKEVNPNYFTRFNFADYIQENQRLFASSNSKNISQNIIKATKGMGDDKRFIIEDPAEAITRAAFKTENLIQNKKIFSAVRALQEDLPDMVIPVRNAADVNTRRALSFENQELRPVLRQVDRIVKRDSAAMRKLQTEINNLEKQGYKISLKEGGQRMTPGDITVSGLGGKVATSRAGTDSGVDFVADINGNLRGNDARTIARNGRQSTEQRAIADEAFGENTGEQGLVFNPTGQSAARKSYQAAQRNKDIIKSRGSAEEQPVFDSKLGRQDTATFVRNLIENNSQADINRLKKMVGRRDAKVASLLDDISIAKQDYDDIDTVMKQNRAEIAERADGDVPPGYEIISGFEDGVEERLAIPQYIADAYKGKNDAQLDVLGRLMMSASKPFKAAATVLSPAFLVKNSIRDTGTHWLTSSNISKAERALILPYAKRWVQGFMDSITNSQFAQQISEAGGGAAGVFADAGGTRTMVRDEAVRAATKSITGQEIKTADNMFKRALEIVDKYSGFRGYRGVMQRAGRALEYAPRLAEARAAIENGGSDAAAAIAARNALGDLQNGGTIGRLLNNYTPFFNSILQGNKRIVDSIRENPQNAMAMLSLGIAAPVVAGYTWNRTMYPDVLNNISEYERENNFIIILGDEKDENGRYTQVIKIPKNDAAKVFGNNLEVALDKMAGQDSQGFAELFMKTIGYAQPISIERDGNFSLDALVGSSPIASNPLFRTPVELATNHSFFTGNEIVPEHLQGLNARDQVTDNTAPIDALAAQVGISPQQAATVRQSVSAGLLNGDNPVDQVSKVVSGTNGTRATNEFYQLRNAMQGERKRASSAVNKAIAANDIAAAQDIVSRYNAKFKETFDPWIEQYGSQATPQMRESFLGLRLVLNSSSIKQRRNNLKKNAE